MSGFEAQNNGEVISIKARAKSNSLTSLFIAIGTLLLAVLMFNLLPEHFFLLAVLVLSAGLVALLLAWFKLREPAFSLLLCRQHIRYRHRAGQWQVDWQNIQRIDTPSLNGQPMNMVAIKLKDYQPLVECISLRLATHLLLEQRPLLLQADSRCTTGTCYAEGLMEDDKHKLPNGKLIKGVKAMYANRLVRLRGLLGYELFLPAAELDRSESEFVQLLKQCQQHALGHVRVD